MIRCATCGQENPEGARFCNGCGSPLAAAPSAGEVRKTVTVLFADVVSSTSRGEQADPESTRRMLARYFDVMRRVVERHGGTVEKFIGDAVMAVFGIPVLHEDDALRAVRAADAIGSAIGRLNEELASASWQPIALRMGVNTGEVVAGDPSGGQTFVTGDAVNVAARLEQAAGPGEVILGAATYRLVRDAIQADPVPALELKGKAEPVAAYRLLGIGDTSPNRRHDTPLVGRERELHLLAEAFRRATDEQACYLFTLLGSAGVGKSRLVHEFLGQVAGDAQVLRGRCLPYGEGITFWPVIELIQVAAGIVPTDPPETERTKVEALLAEADDGPAIMARLASTLGLPGAVVPTEETFWGVRKLLEAVAAKRPLIAVIDDLHWAEPTLLDLIDHIADWSREAPILLLAIARPELLDARPMWSGGKLNATTILLEPLSADASTELIGNLIDDPGVAAAVQGRISETAEGNPLFVEELVAMLLDQGILRREDGGWQAMPDLEAIAIPPTVSALVAARLDHLEPPERDLIGRASVVGKIFQRSAVAELSPPERREDLGPRLMTLVRKELVRPDRSGMTGDEAFRFRHILVRDAAYGSLPKEQRADLHARFADWLQRIAPGRQIEYEEVIAYHLEQAHAYRSELGLSDELTASLAERAATHLRAAGMRAVARNDVHAAANLLTRASTLVDDRERGELLLHIAACSAEMGDLAGAAARHEEAKEAAARAGDEELALRAELTRLELSTITDPQVDEGRILALADELDLLATRVGRAWGHIAAEHARATIYLNACRWMDDLEALERARALMEPGENPWLWNHTNFQIWNSLRYGPVPAPEAIARIQEEAASLYAPANREAFLAPLAAMQGRFEDARRMMASTRAYLRERGMAMRVGDSSLAFAWIEMLAEEFETAHRDLASGIAILQEMGETGVLSTLAAMDADALYRLGRHDEMEAAIQLARATGSPHDIATQAEWRWVAAMAAADDGREDEAQRLIADAVAMIDPTDFRDLRGGVFEGLAHVEARAGRVEGWTAALERALNEHVSKGNVVSARRIRELMAGAPPDPVA
ncbi:MAG: AAA family ATPase [Chloroflexota bacterium]|nr:AAA family ATPase [Chloroflexota bacterium]